MKLSSSRLRWIALAAFLLFIAVATVFWIINGTGPLATAISVLFVALGLVFSFFQVFLPQKSTDSTPPAPLPTKPLKPVLTLATNEATRYDWGTAPHMRQLFGRERELILVKQWLEQPDCRIVMVLGMGGIGKTALAAKAVEEVETAFKALFWRSLQNTPQVEDTLKQCLQFFLAEQLPLQTLDEQLSTLLNHLRTQRCLLILDNVESVFQDGGRAGQYREGYEGYGRLFRALGEAQHQSCLLLTSREKPKEIVHLEGSHVHALTITGVDMVGGRDMLLHSGIHGLDEHWQRFVERYYGHPLALKLAAETVRDIYGGSIKHFLQEGEMVFGDINELLEQQFLRLPPLEQELLYWLAIEREPTTLSELQALLVHHVPKGSLLEALSSLLRRCMIETNEINDTTAFAMLPVIVEYVTNRFVQHVYEELINEQTDETYPCFSSYALMMAQTRDYSRSAQVRFIVQPLIERLQHSSGSEQLQNILVRLLTRIQHTPSLVSGYAAGNLLNMLVQQYQMLSGYDFSRLTVRQAYLQDATLTNLNFSGSSFIGSVFTENFGGILSLAFHPHAPLLAIGTASGEVKLVDIQRGLALFSCHGHSDAVWSVVFSPDGHALASGSQDHTIRLWDTASGECIHTLQVHSARISSLAFSPDGRTLASGGGDYAVRLWETATGTYQRTLVEHDSRVLSVAFSPDGRQLASAGEDMTIQLTELATGKAVHLLQGHTGRIHTIAYHPHRALLASGGEDRVIRLWDSETGTCVAELSGHSDMIRSLSFNQTLLCSGSDDWTVRLWDVEERTCISVLQHHSNRVWSVALSADGKMVASGSDDMTVRAWELQSQRILYSLQGRTAWVWSLAFNALGTQLASSDHSVRLWDTATNQQTAILQGHTNRVRAVVFHPSRALLATASEDRTIRLWDSTTRACIRTMHGHTDWVRTIAWHPDGRLLASGSDDRTIRLWNIETGQCLSRMEGHTKELRSLAFHPAGDLLASGGVDTTIRLWNITDGKEVGVLRGHTGRVRPIAFNRAGLLASGASDHTIRLWNIDTGACVAILKGHTHEIRALSFSPNGELLASSGEDQSIRLWSTITHTCTTILHGHTSRIRALAWHPDDQLLASGSDDGTIRLWHMPGELPPTILRSDKPYEGTNIAATTGLTQGQRTALRLLGAIESLPNV